MYKKISDYPLTRSARKWLALLLCCCTYAAYAQKNNDVLASNRVILNLDGYIIYADVAKAPLDRQADTRLFYYWYSANDIKKTKGGYEGKLLHGWYTRFYPNKNLHTQGKFKNGIQVGDWKYWYLNGELSETRSFSRQGTVATFEAFDEEGRPIRMGKYRNDRYHGTIREMVSGKVVKRKYKDGVEIIRNKKPKRDSVSTATPRNKKFLGIIKRKEHPKKDSVRKDHKFSIKNLFRKKTKTPDTISPSDKRAKESPQPTPTEADTKKKKRREKDTVNPSDKRTKKIESPPVTPAESDKERKKREKKEKKLSERKPVG
jgi:hypothetical protein